jgi:branched-chain amino acid transport system ATP-binding protein
LLTRSGASHELRSRTQESREKFRQDDDYPRRQSRRAPGRASRGDRSERRRKINVVQPISGRLAPSAGSIHLRGENITGLRPFEINRRGLSRSFQVTNIFPRLSVWENVRCAVLWSKGYKYSFWRNVDKLEDVRERTEQILELINMTNRRDIPAGVLTYAEQRALEIGITIAGGADIILLDEPTAGMSRGEAEHAVALIRRVSEGRTLIIIEHDMGVVFNLADRISVLVYGQIIATDEPAKVKANQKVQQAYLGTAGHD